jgi:type II secretory pathway pseudopilin PulG
MPASSAASRPHEAGFMLVEALVALSLFLVVVGAITTVISASANTQARDQSYGNEIQTSQTALAKLVHDLRAAESPVIVGPGTIQFRLVVGNNSGGSTTYNVKYDCTAPDTLGSPYSRCARTQAIYPSAPPAYSSTAGGSDIQHVWNNPTNTSDLASGNDYSAFCKSDGSGPTGSVFFAQNYTIANTDSSPPACDQTYQLIVAGAPDYVQIRVQVPASGDQTRNGLKHFIVLNDGTYLPNLDPSQ